MVLTIVLIVLSTVLITVAVTAAALAIRGAATARRSADAVTAARVEIHRLGVDLDTISRRLRTLSGVVHGRTGGRPRKEEEVDEDDGDNDDQVDAFIHLQSAK